MPNASRHAWSPVPVAIVWGALLALVGGVPAVAGAQSRPDPSGGAKLPSDGQQPPSDDGDRSIRESVELLLSGYHYTPTREDLTEVAASETIAEILRKIAADQSARPSLRLRAVDALALFPSERNEAFLADLLSLPSGDEASGDRQTAELLRHHAISSLAEMLEDARAVERLGRFLRSDDVQLELTTITALGRHAGAPGLERLRRRADEVDSEVVREQLKTYVDVDGEAKGE
ncbi:MAG: HEAT repeat domain-containing protein [Bradymonadaceae bacterium]